jgi:hypothetical protein
LLWEYAAPGNKYLLVLNKAGHRILAGSEAGGRFAGKRHADAEMLGPQGGKRRMADAPQPGGFGDWWGKAGRPQPDLGYKQVAAVASVTAAFLDATVKNDEFARFWLSDKAAGWLKQAGELRLR